VGGKRGETKGSAAHREIFDEMLGLVTQLSVEDEFPAPLQQQQLIKGIKDVDAGLVDGTHNCPACVDNVTHCAHHNGCCSRIQTCISLICRFIHSKSFIQDHLITHALICSSTRPPTHSLLTHS